MMSDGAKVLRWWMRGDGVQDAVLVRLSFEIGSGGGGRHCVAIVFEKVGAVVVVIAVLCVTVQSVEASQVLSGEPERWRYKCIVVGLGLGHGDEHVSIAGVPLATAGHVSVVAGHTCDLFSIQR